jgi:hypothetical protein
MPVPLQFTERIRTVALASAKDIEEAAVYENWCV